MSPAMTALLAGGGAALGGGVGYMAGKRKKNRDKQSSDAFALDVMRRAVIKKACDLQRKAAAKVLCHFLDKTAQVMSLEKSAAVRALQKEVASGKPLSVAIKTAYPTLSGEQRGILATHMVRSALTHQRKQADALTGPENVMAPSNATITTPGVPQVQPRTFQGNPQQGLAFMKQAGNFGNVMGAAGRAFAPKPPMMPHAEPDIGALGAQAMGPLMPGVMQRAVGGAVGGSAAQQPPQQMMGGGTVPASAGSNFGQLGQAMGSR
jgi:hypothetical protein